MVFDKFIVGKKVVFMKKVIDICVVFKIGGIGLVFKKGKF